MIKFAHSVFALPFALMAAFLAARRAYEMGDSSTIYPAPGALLLIVACMVSARSVAMTFNRIVDMSVDARNPRTANRALPAGSITRGQALVFMLAAAGVFVLCCAGFGVFYENWIPSVLSGPVLGFLCFYSYTKRFTRWSHVVLGAALALSPLGAWLAVHPDSVGSTVLVLMGIVTLWVGGFDVIYACQDIEFDRRQGLFSLPAVLGPRKALWLVRFAHIIVVLLLITLMILANLGWLYAIGVGLVAVLLLVENLLVSPHDFSRVNVAFFTINGVVSLVLGTVTIIDCLLRLGPLISLGQ
jgi:4-hydroxybenzoate polyprenyltransferase